MRSSRRWLRSLTAVVIGFALVGMVAYGVCARTEQPVRSVSHSRIIFSDSSLGGTSIRATQAVTVTVQASAVYNPDSGAWTYSYTVTNGPSSQNAMDHFAVAPIARLIRVNAPTHWDHEFYPYQGGDSGIVWAAVDVGQLPPGYVDTGNIPPSEYAIQPGHDLVFSFTTRAPPLSEPQRVTWYAQGFDTIPDIAEEDEDVPQGTVFTDAVTGTAIGPDKSSLVGVGPERTGRLQFELPRPNPAQGSVSIGFELPKPGSVRITVYDVAGRRERTLVDGLMQAGMHSVSWNGRNDLGRPCRPGLYFLRMFLNGAGVGDRRVTILK